MGSMNRDRHWCGEPGPGLEPWPVLLEACKQNALQLCASAPLHIWSTVPPASRGCSAACQQKPANARLEARATPCSVRRSRKAPSGETVAKREAGIWHCGAFQIKAFKVQGAAKSTAQGLSQDRNGREITGFTHRFTHRLTASQRSGAECS